MSDIQRYSGDWSWGYVADGDPYAGLYESAGGELVKYDDHVAAVAAAEERVKSDFAKYLRHMVDDDKFGAGVKAAREAVAAHIRADLTGQEMFCGRKRGILAAIDALRGGS